jgi:DNA-binding response OmpR family regulator
MATKSILVVDDERNIRLTLSRALESPDWSVQTAVNGEEGLQKMATTDIALVLLDLKMPGMSGLEFLELVRRRWPQVRVIIITAHGTIESAVEAMKLGAVDFIQKPFSPDQIRELVRGVLARETIDEREAADYPTLVELAKRHIADRNFEAAREVTRRAIALKPEQPEAYNLLGALLEVGGDRLEAQKFYRAALDIDPTYKPARTNLDRLVTWRQPGRLDLGAESAPGGSSEEKDGS